MCYKVTISLYNGNGFLHRRAKAQKQTPRLSIEKGFVSALVPFPLSHPLISFWFWNTRQRPGGWTWTIPAFVSQFLFTWTVFYAKASPEVLIVNIFGTWENHKAICLFCDCMCVCVCARVEFRLKLNKFGNRSVSEMVASTNLKQGGSLLSSALVILMGS